MTNTTDSRFSKVELRDAERLLAIDESGLLSNWNSPELDRMTSLICDVLNVPVSLVSIVTDDRQVFPGAKGLAAPWDDLRETPLSHSFCQYVVTSDLPLQVDDSPCDALVCDNLAIKDLGVKAYLGTPIRDGKGNVLGSLCAIETRSRKWTSSELKILEGFSATITAQLQARKAIDALSVANQKLVYQESRLLRITNTANVKVAELSKSFKYLFANTAYAELYGEGTDSIIGKKMQEVLGETAFSIVQPYLQRVLDGEAVEHDFEVPSGAAGTTTLRVRYAPEQDKTTSAGRIVIAATDVSEQRLMSRLAERLNDRLTAAHQMSPDGFMVFKSVRNDENVVVDFEWEYVNDPGAKMANHTIQKLIGKRLLSVLPGNKDEGLFDAYIEVVRSGQPYRKTHFYEHDGISLWIDISAIKLGDGFAVSFADVTERKRAEIALSDGASRLQRILDNVVAFVGVMTQDGVLKEVNQPALDVANLKREDVIGKPFWQAYWWSFSDDSQLRLKKAIKDARSGKQSRYDAKIRISETQYIWIDFQLSPQFNADGHVVELIPSGTDITERKKAEAQRMLLVNELNHRVKNSLATIQAMARQTIRGAVDMQSFETVFTARLNAISTAHEILVGSQNAQADLLTMIDRQVGPYVDSASQLNLTGDKILLAAECAHSIGLVMHELATNAAKYGALSVKDGVINIVSKDLGDGNAKIIWSESGGPEVTAPKSSGFGSRLIKQSIEFSLGGSVDINYAKSGLIVSIVMPKDFDHG